MPADTIVRVVADIPGERLDLLVARLCDITRARAQKLIADGHVRAHLAPAPASLRSEARRRRSL
jgi:hypothetical protein